MWTIIWFIVNCNGTIKAAVSIYRLVKSSTKLKFPRNMKNNSVISSSDGYWKQGFIILFWQTAGSYICDRFGSFHLIQAQRNKYVNTL